MMNLVCVPMNNPISTVLRRPAQDFGRLESTCNLSSYGGFFVSDSFVSDSSATNRDKARKQSELYEWEGEFDHSDDWLSEAGDVIRLAVMAPFSSVELVGKSMAVGVDNDTCPIPDSHQSNVEWGSGQDWIEEISHALKFSLSAPVNCIELLGKSLPDSEEDKITL